MLQMMTHFQFAPLASNDVINRALDSDKPSVANTRLTPKEVILVS